MKIKQFTRDGVPHVVFKDPTSSGCIALPIGPGHSPFAEAGNAWSWDGNAEAPTLTPSVKCSTDHFFVRNGQVEFCGDAPHGNAGKTVPLEDLGDLADFWKSS